MANTHLLLGEPTTYSPPAAIIEPKRRLTYRERYPDAMPTDILEWLKDNQPHHSGELADLRKTLYSRRSHGRYRIRQARRTLNDEERFVVTGPAGPLLIVSNKSRHFLLRTLCRLRRDNGWPPMTRQGHPAFRSNWTRSGDH
jgi:hypothetical protein